MNANSQIILAPFYRRFQLPWEGDEEASNRFRRLALIGLAIFAVVGVLVPLLSLPEPERTAEEAVPERLARIMVEEKPPPPPPPPPPPKEVEPPKPTDRPQPRPIPQPVDRVAEARKQAQNAAQQIQDELADLRRDLQDEPISQTRNLTGAVGADTKAERSLITSKVGAGSAGVQSTNSSRGFGSGAGSLSGHTTTSVSSRVGAIGSGNAAARTGGSGKASRSDEEVRRVIDRNKGAVYALYNRALRDRPELKGKLVLEFTIAPSGEVTACRVVSSELDDADLERKIVARFRLIRFESLDVAPMVTTAPIEFFPA